MHACVDALVTVGSLLFHSCQSVHEGTAVAVQLAQWQVRDSYRHWPALVLYPIGSCQASTAQEQSPLELLLAPLSVIVL